MRLNLVFASLALGLGVVACTQDFDAFTRLDASAADAPTDAPADAPANDAASDAPTADAGLTYACGTSGTVANCAQCSGQPEPCVFCNQTTPSMLTGKCLAANVSCFGTAPNGYELCGCNTGVSACPEPNEVCRMGFCRTCSDSTNNNTLMCKGGGTCTSTDGGCN